MLDIVSDLHLHSKYSRAVSPQMTLPVLAQVGRQKGIELLATGDWTHPIWFREIRDQLEESEEGLYKLKISPNVILNASEKSHSTNKLGMLKQTQDDKRETRFLLSVEIACIYSQGGKGRRIHNLVFVPNFETAEKVNKALFKRGCNLSADGRPIIGLSSKNLLQLILEIDERSLLIPAHVWTPWFGIYGQLSGFNSLSEAFEDLAPFVYGIETGLSSDPEMNWQMKELATRSILSFSDAHSAPKMGREATVFRIKELSYNAVREAIMWPSIRAVEDRKLKMENGKGENLSSTLDPLSSNRVLYTIEFYPEEGKYHYSGHRNCQVTMAPEKQQLAKGICPVCKRKVTDGVMRRVMELSQEEPRGLAKENNQGLVWISDPQHKHPPFVKIVPLLEIIAEALSMSVASSKAKGIFDALCKELTSELHILLQADTLAIEKIAAKVTTSEKAQKVAEGIKKVREAHIVITPGFDGVYGKVKIWDGEENEKGLLMNDKEENEKKSQIGLEF